MVKLKAWKVLFIKDSRSSFDLSSISFDRFFSSTDVVDEDKALELFESSQYDIVISDLSFEPERLGFMKRLRDIKTNQEMFALVSPEDTAKLYGIADLGINAFELVPEQLEQALEVIAHFDPNDKGQ